jgi:SAM-dependent methyltransferase
MRVERREEPRGDGARAPCNYAPCRHASCHAACCYPLTSRPSPFDEPELYDLVFEGYREDIPFWLDEARRGKGPVLDLACGTGRVLLPILEAGIDADGLDLFAPMLERARAKAEAIGKRPRLVRAPMHEFRMPRRYRRIVCAFNAFAHNVTPAEQLSALRTCREHLEDGGALLIHLGLPCPELWSAPQGTPILEGEVSVPARGTRLQVYDTRMLDPVEQTQQSEIEIREVDAKGQTVASHRSWTDLRWIAKPEMELLFRIAGFARWTFFGGYDRRPLEKASQWMIAKASV